MLSRWRFVWVLGAVLVVGGCTGAGTYAGQTPAPKAEPPISIAGSSKVLAVVQKLAEAYKLAYAGARFEFVQGIDSIPAIREVGAGTIDLGLSSREIPSAEATSSVEARPFARDAVVFATNASAALSGVSSAQVRAIYAGQITNWGQLGLPAGAILVLDREESDSAHKELLKLMAETPVQARTVVYFSSSDMLDALATTPGTIGFSQLGLLGLRQSSSIKMLALDGIAAGPDTLTSGTYPLDLTFYIVHRATPPPGLRRFLDFIYGPDGGRILQEYGYVAISS